MKNCTVSAPMRKTKVAAPLKAPIAATATPSAKAQVSPAALQWFSLDQSVKRAATIVGQTIDLMKLFAEDSCSDVAFGLVKLVETLEPTIHELLGISEKFASFDDALEDLSCSLIEVSEVVRIVNNELNDPMAGSALSLLTTAKEIVDGAHSKALAEGGAA